MKQKLVPLPRDVVFPPPLTPTIMITAGFLVHKSKHQILVHSTKRQV